MSVFLLKAFQLILAFAILVIIHEFGHFLFARIFGVRVEKFYIFFDPWKEIFKWKPKRYWGFFGKTKKTQAQLDEEAEEKARVEQEKAEADAGNLEVKDAEIIKAPVSENTKEPKKKKKGFWKDTEYGIGWLPLGGYCKISGMIDESMDTEQMKKPPQPWEFRTKPAWQRLLIMIAGVLFNFLLAILIYSAIVWWWGEEYVPFKESKGLTVYSDVAQKYGFQDGDIPLMADGKAVDNLNEDSFDIGNARTVTVLRNGKDTVVISLPSDFLAKLNEGAKNDSRGIGFISLDIPVVVKEITSKNASDAGLRKGDRIIGVNEKVTLGATKFMPALAGHANETVNITVLRNGSNPAQPDTVVLPIKLDGASKIGFQLENDLGKLFNSTKVQYGVIESVPRGIHKGSKMMVDYVSSLRQVFTKEGAQSIGGFGAIGSMFPSSWDWYAFWNIAAFLSVALAFMNILPIPGLDGGHVFFLLCEVITGRKPSDKFMTYAQVTGMIILILLLLYANGMDLVRLFK